MRSATFETGLRLGVITRAESLSRRGLISSSPIALFDFNCLICSYTNCSLTGCNLNLGIPLLLNQLQVEIVTVVVTIARDFNLFANLVPMLAKYSLKIVAIDLVSEYIIPSDSTHEIPGLIFRDVTSFKVFHKADGFCLFSSTGCIKKTQPRNFLRNPLFNS
jgi:hypothetical protein